MAEDCPWCGAVGKYLPNGSGRVLEWACGSWQSKGKSYQESACKNDVLRAEIERLEEKTKRFYTDTQQAQADTRKVLELSLEQGEKIKLLQIIVDKLPKTADGMPVVPNQANVFYRHPDGGKVYERSYEADLEDSRSHRDAKNNVIWVSIGDCYSTREAAKAEGGE